MKQLFSTLRSGMLSRGFIIPQSERRISIANRGVWQSSSLSSQITPFGRGNHSVQVVPSDYRRWIPPFGLPSLHSVVTRDVTSKAERPDPFARRPTAKCDPYGQKGKPLTMDEAEALLRTVEAEWEILDETMKSYGRSRGDNNSEDTKVPFAIRRDFWHEEYMAGAQFINHIAAVAEMNAQHFPFQIVLDRKLDSRSKSWKICTRIVCRTHVLQGLSHHDFYLATLIDIEIERPEVRTLVLL